MIQAQDITLSRWQRGMHHVVLLSVYCQRCYDGFIIIVCGFWSC